MKDKLVKIISNALNVSRRQASELIKGEAVKVNKVICTEYSKEINTQTDRVLVNNKQINFTEEYSYYALYKPRGIVTSKKGLEYYTKKIGIENLTYAGRLDKESEGLLILSNDGDYIQRITHPSYSHSKEYKVTVAGLVNKTQLQLINRLLKTHRQNKCKILKNNQENTMLGFTLHEGKNKQIRNICQDAELEVIKLKRISVGNITIKNLKAGQWRDIKSEIV